MHLNVANSLRKQDICVPCSQAECPLNYPLGDESMHSGTHMLLDLSSLCISLVGAVKAGKKMFDFKMFFPFEEFMQLRDTPIQFTHFVLCGGEKPKNNTD